MLVFIFNHLKKFKAGFTLIEVLVVIGVITIALPALFAIVFAIFRQQFRIYALQEVKRQGDNALGIIQDITRNYGVGIYSDPGLTTEKCADKGSNYSDSLGTNFYFKDKSGNRFKFYVDTDSDKLASESQRLSGGSPITETFDLNSPKVRILQVGSTPFISCERTSAYSPPTLTINFKVEYNTASEQPENKAEMIYQTKIKMRNY